MIFKPLGTTDVVSGRIQKVTTGLWSGGDFELKTFFTSSDQTKITGSSQLEVLNGMYYYSVYNEPSSSITAEPQFSVTYGHRGGSGSILNLVSGGFAPTQAIYNQYKNVLLAPNDEVFTFRSGSSDVNSEDIYVINFNTNRFKEKLDPGTLQFVLSGSNGRFTFIDDSLSGGTSVSTDRVFNIVSGSIDNGPYIQGSVTMSVGLLYTDVGMILLNPTQISSIVGSSLTPNLTTSSYALNQGKLFDAIKMNGHASASFQARSTEYIPARHYFIRVGNQEFNYSNNPSFVLSNQTNTDDNGKLRFEDFYNDPKVYVTTVGLYNDSNDLIAVAKLAQPFVKEFSSEALIRVKIDF